MRPDRRIRDAVARHGLDLSLYCISKSRVHERESGLERVYVRHLSRDTEEKKEGILTQPISVTQKRPTQRPFLTHLFPRLIGNRKHK